MASTTGLYSPEFERDACGIGFVANIKGNKSHQIFNPFDTEVMSNIWKFSYLGSKLTKELLSQGTS